MNSGTVEVIYLTTAYVVPPTMAIRCRGIYATALTAVLLEAGKAVVQASEPIEERFDEEFPTEPAQCTVQTTSDRQGVEVSGDPAVVESVVESLDIARDTVTFADPAPVGSVFVGEVTATKGGGALVALPAGTEGYLPFETVDGYVDIGDTLVVQVRRPEPPWTDAAPELGTAIKVPGSIVTLERGSPEPTAFGSGDHARELVRMTDLLDVSLPDDWGVHWHRGALDADMDTKTAAIEEQLTVASEIEEALADDHGDGPVPRAVAPVRSTQWVWFGRESRFALDSIRDQVTTTMTGHHRIKAGAEAASSAVDFVEAVCTEPRDEFPFEVCTRQFGPRTGDSLSLVHGKPNGDRYTLGTGDVVDIDSSGTVTIKRTIQSSGTYDGLGTPRQPGDIAITKLTEGRWWYPTVYRSNDGADRGTYVNVCTPVEVFPDAAIYMDLHVDVLKQPDGEVSVVDEDELQAAQAAGKVSEPLASQARSVANRVRDALEPDG